MKVIPETNHVPYIIISTCLLYNTSNEEIVLVMIVWLLDLQLSICN